LRLLTRAGFEVSIHHQMHLTDRALTNRRTAALAVIDCSDLEPSLEFVRNLRARQPGLPVLVLLPKVSGSKTYSLLRLGVKGVLPYGHTQRELPRAAAELARGGHWIPRNILTGFIESILPELQGSESLNPGIEISRREREVLDLLLENLSNKEIAAKLYVSERTVKFHVSNLLGKFGVQRRSDLIVLWLRRATASGWNLERSPEPGIPAHIN
jgi:DNA-binding NarL/FixJ family response regulator